MCVLEKCLKLLSFAEEGIMKDMLLIMMFTKR